MSFPSTLGSYTIVQPTNRLNSPSHSSVHNQVSSAVGQLEAVIGVDGANSVLGTIIGDLRSPGSPGGGHVQTASVGGTGQTGYTKGDILVASAPTTLSKLAVGTNNQVLSANSATGTGLQWANFNVRTYSNVGKSAPNANAAGNVIWNHVSSASDNFLVVVTTALGPVSSVTFANSVLTKANAVNSVLNQGAYQEIWTLQNPPTSVAQVIVSFPQLTRNRGGISVGIGNMSSIIGITTTSLASGVGGNLVSSVMTQNATSDLVATQFIVGQQNASVLQNNGWYLVTNANTLDYQTEVNATAGGIRMYRTPVTKVGVHNFVSSIGSTGGTADIINGLIEIL